MTTLVGLVVEAGQPAWCGLEALDDRQDLADVQWPALGTLPKQLTEQVEDEVGRSLTRTRPAAGAAALVAPRRVSNHGRLALLGLLRS